MNSCVIFAGTATAYVSPVTESTVPAAISVSVMRTSNLVTSVEAVVPLYPDVPADTSTKEPSDFLARSTSCPSRYTMYFSTEP